MDEINLETFILHLKRKVVAGSFHVSQKTAQVLRHYISISKWPNAKVIIDQIKSIGKRLIDAQPLEFCIGNIVRRVLFIIREEYITLKRNLPNLIRLDSSKNNLLTYEDPDTIDYSSHIPTLKSQVIEAIGELIEEMKGLHKNVAEHAIEHIHSNEIIMTFGCSRTVEQFLVEAARKRKFGVIVVESAPSLEGRKTALTLSKNPNIDVTLIPDSAIFALMSRVNKVIIGTHAVMANGGLIAPSGTHSLVVAAKYHSVPIVVCTGLYKLCPLYAYDQDTFNDFGSPGEYLKFQEAEYLVNVHSYNPSFDYIPPELVSLFITNNGGHNPSYIYRLLQEYYDPRDMLEDDDEDVNNNNNNNNNNSEISQK
ncbi:translation initiation factor eIF-2B beta subunit [Tieghemostelium lacteum]|uniref:Translation initiation factor eIF2B subunit beta n=1 Tax=Tieghemostelium lacteum TaxID=361077 RepID=A0A152A404_TIELA|nr:translation initiation factor eIF-2B beta subunit [Tieghemostelium lacteum]|eukprot:KYR00968.1 translation initiation factor eIF-2B beta subunit [Tieghemostelium lacteum]